MTKPRTERSKKTDGSELAAAAVGTALSAAGAALAPGATTAAVGLAAAGGAGPFIVKKLSDFWGNLRDRRYERWFEGLVAASGKTPEDVALQFAAKIEDPTAAKVIVESLRDLLNVVDEAVIPALGQLTWAYVSHDRAIDGFFRGLARLLCDLDADVLRELQELALFIEGSGAGIDVSLRYAPFHDVDAVYDDHGASDEADGESSERMIELPSVRRLFHLLKAHGLSEDFGEGDTLKIRHRTACKIAAVVAPLSTKYRLFEDPYEGMRGV